MAVSNTHTHTQQGMDPVCRRARKSASSRRKSISNYTNRVAAIARRTALHISSIINSPRRHGRKKGKKSFSDFLRVVVVVGQKKKQKWSRLERKSQCVWITWTAVKCFERRKKKEERRWWWVALATSDREWEYTSVIWMCFGLEPNFQTSSWHLGLTQPTTLCSCYGVHPPPVDTQTRCLVKIGPGRTDLGGRWRIPAVDVHWIFPQRVEKRVVGIPTSPTSFSLSPPMETPSHVYLSTPWRSCLKRSPWFFFCLWKSHQKRPPTPPPPVPNSFKNFSLLPPQRKVSLNVSYGPATFSY